MLVGDDIEFKPVVTCSETGCRTEFNARDTAAIAASRSMRFKTCKVGEWDGLSGKQGCICRNHARAAFAPLVSYIEIAELLGMSDAKNY